MLQRAEMVRRIAEEIEGYVIELGADGRLVLLQLEELIGGVEDDRRLVAKDYFQSTDGVRARGRAARGSPSSTTKSCSTSSRWPACCTSPPTTGLDGALQPRGYRLLHKIPRLPELVSDHIVDRFSQPAEDHAGELADLIEVEGVGEARAKAIKEGLSRLAETSILERYV